MSHPLDLPAWSALNTRHAKFAEGGTLARRFPVDVSPISGIANHSAKAAAALAPLVPAGDDVSLMDPGPPPAPAGLVETLRVPLLQMVAREIAAVKTEFKIEQLGDEDSAGMLELALLTKPGPFRTRTHRLGRFIGVRVDGRLIAMAGERLAVPSYREISAVCTHPDFRGRGLAAALMSRVGARIVSEGDQLCLHAYPSNPAIGLYRKLGFETRAEIEHVVWARPGESAP